MKKKYKYILAIYIIIMTLTYIFFYYCCLDKDGLFHIKRMNSIFLSIKNGYFLSFIAEDFLNGFGYPSLGFYPYLLMVPFSLLQFFSIPDYICYLTYIIFINIITIFTANIFISEVIKDDRKFYFLLFYIGNPFRLTMLLDLKCGMLTAYMILPLLFLSLYKIFNNEDGTKLLTLSMTLMIYSHIISSFLTIIVVIFICIFEYKKIKKNPMIIFKIITSGIICLLLTSVIIFPILEQIVSSGFAYEINHFPFLIYYLYIENKYVKFCLFTLSILLILFLYKKYKSKVIIINIILLIMLTNIFPWDYLYILKYIQSTQRILLFTGITFGLYFVKNPITNIKKIILYINIICSLIIFSVSMCHYHNNVSNTFDINKNTCMYQNYISLGDYLPENYVLQVEPKNTEFVNYDIFDSNLILNLNENFEYQIIDKDTIKFTNNENDEIILPKLFYKGYCVKINGTECNIKEGKYGMIVADINMIKEGTIEISYPGTLIQYISKIITIITLTIIIMLYIKKSFIKLQLI